MSYRVNIGCGATPTDGFINFDNSLSVRLARSRILAIPLAKAGLLADNQRNFLKVVQSKDVRWADAARAIPLPAGSVSLVYSSHMMEHLTREESQAFLREVLRILATGGVLRLVLPDLRKQAEEYLRTGNADGFVEATLLAGEKPASLLGRLKLAFVGPRHHLWNYDVASATQLLLSVGFRDVRHLAPGQTTILDPGSLKLREREEDSFYLEARQGSLPRS